MKRGGRLRRGEEVDQAKKIIEEVNAKADQVADSNRKKTVGWKRKNSQMVWLTWVKWGKQAQRLKALDADRERRKMRKQKRLEVKV